MRMRDFAESLITLPMPVLAILILGLTCWRWHRLSRALFAIGTSLFLVLCMPVVGQLLAYPLSGEPTVPAGIAGFKPEAIVVPTAGVFDDGTGSWWASSTSIQRVTLGMRVQERFGLPLILSGGSPVAGQPAEATIIGRQFNLAGRKVMVEDTARDSLETGLVVARMIKNAPSRRVVLVTSDLHMARMAASLRHAGLAVLELPVPSSEYKFRGGGDFLPSSRGLAISREAVREYFAILWYLATDRLDLLDLTCAVECYES